MDTTTTFDVKGTKYQARKMSVFTQFHVARRLGPLLTHIGKAVQGGDKDDTWTALAAMTDVIGRMSDEDLNYIMDACLAVVYRQDNSSGREMWAPVRVGSVLMYQEDIDMPTMLHLVYKVLEANLASFFSANPASLLGAGRPQ